MFTNMFTKVEIHEKNKDKTFYTYIENLQNILQNIEIIETGKFYQVSQYEFVSIPTKGLQLTCFKDYKLENITDVIEVFKIKNNCNLDVHKME